MSKNEKRETQRDEQEQQLNLSGSEESLGVSDFQKKLSRVFMILKKRKSRILKLLDSQEKINESVSLEDLTSFDPDNDIITWTINRAYAKGLKKSISVINNTNRELKKLVTLIDVFQKMNWSLPTEAKKLKTHNVLLWDVAYEFWKQVERTDDQDSCWLWTGKTNNDGYGKFNSVLLNVSLAHRASYILSFGAIPDGLHVLHVCDNPRCVRPAHLFLGTQQDNILDMQLKGRHYVPPPIASGEDNPNAKLTVKKVALIRYLCSENFSVNVLTSLFGVCESTIRGIKHGNSYRGVQAEPVRYQDAFS